MPDQGMGKSTRKPRSIISFSADRSAVGHYRRSRRRYSPAICAVICRRTLRSYCLEAMDILVTYDIADTEGGGASRLKRIAEVCGKYGQRVQLSVFECRLSPARWLT